MAWPIRKLDSHQVCSGEVPLKTIDLANPELGPCGWPGHEDRLEREEEPLRTRSQKKTGVATAACITLLALAIAVPATAQAAPADPDPTAAATVLRPVDKPRDGKPLPETGGIPSDVRQKIQQLVEGPDGVHINDLVWDRETRTLEVHVLEGEAAEVEDDVRAAVGDSFRFVQDAYDVDRLEAEAFELAKSAVAAGVPVVSVRTTQDNSGLLVSVADPSTTADQTTTQKLASLAEDTGIPLAVETTTDEPETTSGWRWADQSPFYGGSRIYKPGAGACTSAFPVVAPVTGGYQTAMLTADHCGAIGDVWRSGQAGADNWALGTMTDGNSGGSDFKRIALANGAGIQGRVYTGAEYSSTSLPVKARSYPVTGDVICPSGAYSGLNCLAEVQSTGDVLCFVADGGLCYNNLVTVHSTSDTPLFGMGDSGGPVVAGWNGGVVGFGVITGVNTGGNNVKTCVGVQGARECSVVGYIANIKAFFDNNPTWNLLGG